MVTLMCARVVELADTPDLGSGVARRAGSSPVPGKLLRSPSFGVRSQAYAGGTEGTGISILATILGREIWAEFRRIGFRLPQ